MADPACRHLLRRIRPGCPDVHYRVSYSFLVDELTSLARAAGRGDRDALARLVRQTQGDVWRFCAHLVDPAAADDLAQETYLRAIPALRRFRGDAAVGGGSVAGGALGQFLLSPAVTVGCRVTMGVVMTFMLLIAI